MILVKFNEGVVAMADSDLIGKEFEEGEKYLKVSERFYKGEEETREEIIKVMKNASNINIVGKEVVEIALEEGFIKKEDIIKIQGVPHAQIYNLSDS
jgi:uncharacterized protein